MPLLLFGLLACASKATVEPSRDARTSAGLLPRLVGRDQQGMASTYLCARINQIVPKPGERQLSAQSGF